ncbi:MAG: hypothetical protein KKH68_04850 [Proteobacteria bacterium]|nr:hypothetical protein [Pseudomonadota bacterium]
MALGDIDNRSAGKVLQILGRQLGDALGVDAVGATGNYQNRLVGFFAFEHQGFDDPEQAA